MDRELIERLAEECGYQNSDGYLPELADEDWIISDLCKLVALLADECAKVCEGVDDEGVYSPAEAAVRIREKFSA